MPDPRILSAKRLAEIQIEVQDFSTSGQRYSVVRLLEHIKALEEQNTWQPIETAPKNGTSILLYEKPFIDIAQWSDIQECWWEGNYKLPFPTHWQPLPNPPEAKTDA